MRTRILSSSFWITLFGLLLVASMSLRAQAEEAGDRMEKRKIVYVDPQGHEHAWESGQQVKRGYLGVGLTELSPELRTHFGASEAAGVMVSHVETGSPAEKAGLKVGDIITAIDGGPVESSWDLRRHLHDLANGTVVALEVNRGGKTSNLSAAIEQRERPEIDMAPLFRKEAGDDDHIFLHMDAAHMAEPMVVGPMRHSAREVELEKRLKELEKRINELEARLPKR
jgi:membrane-associated protease RseP (regulator of RpoE activity)